MMGTRGSRTSKLRLASKKPRPKAMTMKNTSRYSARKSQTCER